LHQDDPTTQISPVHVHQHPQNQYATTEPERMAQQLRQAPAGDAISAGEGDARNRAAQAGSVTAHAAGNQQKVAAKNKKIDHEDISRIVAEENASKGKLPKYPGLERWQLIEKMGDGAFSNVYRARDLEGKAGEVAIKVVRKFEMNSSQVSLGNKASDLILPCEAPLTNVCLVV
jgi:serine/threonine-protein kinase RCK2